MPYSEVMYSSDDMTWETPKELFDKLDREFIFTVDVCAMPYNAKVKNYFTPEVDGLKQTWEGTCWMNCPYGKELKTWVKKAYESSLSGAKVVCLIPARTDTQYWHEYCMQAAEIRFIKGRVKFGNSMNNAGHPAPFPSAIVVFDKNKSGQLKITSYLQK